MLSVPRTRVQTRLTLTILAVILLSWVLSAGVANYFAYVQIRSVREAMLARPDIYPAPVLEPRFGLREFLFGPLREPRMGTRPEPPPPRRPDGPPGPPPPPVRPADAPITAARAVVVLVLALAAGAWLGRKFTGPLDELSTGASAYRSGRFDHRVQACGDDEFAGVARAMNEMAERVSAQLESMREDAERRRQFLADVAHELRSPVATIRTMAGALEDGVAASPERAAQAVTALARTSERLLRLVEDLMDLSRLDLKELPLHARPADLGAIVDEVVRSHDADARQARMTIAFRAPGQPVVAVVDPDRITQALHNVLDNAVSYAGPGAEVNVQVEGGARARIVISDNGRGIALEHLDHVFEPFYRADAARTPGDRHTGLGLRIARGLVEAHSGTMELISQEGAGTEVTIELPVAGLPG